MAKFKWLGVCVALALLGAMAPAWGQLRGVTLVSATGPATVRRSGTTAYTAAARRMTLGAGDVVRTGANGGVILLFPDGSEIKVRANSALVIPAISGVGGPDRVQLNEGRIWARMSRGKGARFEAGRTAVAGVRGTELDLQLDADETATLTVAEGEVRFYNERGSVVVGEAEQSVARPGEAPSAPVTANLPVVLEWTNALLPVVLVQEIAFVSQDPAELERAAAELERGVGAVREPPLPERRLREGDVRHDQGRLTEALAAYDRALRLGRDGDASWEARLEARRGQTLLELGQLDEAEAAFRRAVGAALRGRPSPAATEERQAAQSGLAMTLLARGDVDGARAEAAAGVQEAGDAAGAGLSLTLALVELRRGDMAAASAALDRALAADPRNAAAHAARSVVLRARNDLAGAESEARQAVALAPRSAVARQALADAQFLLGRPEEARREAREAVALNPLSTAAHVSLANAELQRGNVEEAVREGQQAVTLDPRSDRAQYTLGAALAEQRRYGMAERHLRRAVALNPELLDARSLLGRVLARRGNRTAAVEMAQGSLDRNPDLPSARASLGQVYWLQGRLKEAAREYEAALALSPRSGLYHMEVARVYLDQNNMPAALSHALQGAFLLPGSSEAHAMLGLVYDRQDNQEQAVREYSEALSLSPENSLARLGLVTAFTPRSRELFGSGRERLRERAQALLRDPAVLELTFKPGVTSELAGSLGNDSLEEQQFLHRGQFAQGRVHDLTIASRASEDGYRRNGSADHRLVQTDIAVQATPLTQVLVQYSGEKFGFGIPESVLQPDLNARGTLRLDQYNLHVRRQLGGRTHFWLKYGMEARRASRTDPDAVPNVEPPRPPVPDLGLFKLNGRADSHIPEFRLDHDAGGHHFTYGLALLRNNVRLLDLKYALPGPSGAVVGNPLPDLQIVGTVIQRDVRQYIQDDYRIGNHGALILGMQMLHLKEHTFQQLFSRLGVPPGESPIAEDLGDTRESQHDLLPYFSLTYRLGARNLVRLLGNQVKPRPLDPLLAPSEAFIVGEPISLYFAGGGPSQSRAETYELDYERRFSPRTFGKLFLQYSLARDFIIQPSRDQEFVPSGFLLPTVREQIAGVRFEHQITRHLSGFTRWSYYKVENAADTVPSSQTGEPVPDPSHGLQVPFVPHWRGLTGFNYVDSSGTKLRLAVTFLSRRYTDTGFGEPGTFGTDVFVRGDKRPSTGPHALVDLRIAKEPSVAMEYSLSVINLLNTTFPDNHRGFPTRGRTWAVTLARRF